jgi:hypothetical protein
MYRFYFILLYICSVSPSTTTPLFLPTHITKDTIIDGGFKQCAISSSITVPAQCTLTLKNCVLTNIKTQSFCMDTSSTLILNNCAIILDANVAWTNGSIIITACCHLTGPYQWHHNSASPLIIDSASALLITNGCTLYCNASSPTNNCIIFKDSSSTLSLSRSNLRCGPCGLVLTKGTLVINEECLFTPDSTDPRAGIYLGSGKCSADNATVVMANTNAKIKVVSPHLYERKKPQSFIQKGVAALSDAAPILTVLGGFFVLSRLGGSNE